VLATEGLDASPEMLAVARRRHPDRALHLGPAWRLPHADASLDAIFSLHLMMHLPPAEREAILAEGARVLRQGGLFIFDIPSAERRRWVGPRAQGWHGGSAMTVAQLRTACPQLHLRERRGLLALPLHRIPEALRPSIAPVEALLGASPLSPWCSYHLACLERR
jgi:SAM-dependent methyltransferase